MNFVRKIRGLRLGHDGSLEKLAVPLWPDAGKAFGLSRNHTYDAARTGEIPTIKIGHCLLVPLAALNKMLGVDIVTISKRLGHASSDVTLRFYGHMFRRDDGKAAAAINAALAGSAGS